MINNRIRQLRVEELNVEDEAVKDLFHSINVEGLGLVTIDKKTGGVQDARQIGVGETIIIPYIIVFLMFIMLMMSAIPLLTAVMEEKMNKTIDWDITTTQAPIGLTGRMESPTVIITFLE